jgi:hypothetical protein
VILVPFLLAQDVILGMVGRAVAPFGCAGGFAVGFLQAFLLGWYLLLLDISLRSQRTLKPDDIMEQPGTLFIPTIAVLFIVGLPLWFLGQSVGAALIYILIASIVANPGLEIVSKDRTEGLESLRRCVDFMQNNWPEWLVFNGLLFGASVLLHILLPTAFSTTSFGASLPLSATPVQGFGPLFLPLHQVSPDQLLHIPSLLSLVAATAALHFVMVCRGALFRELSSGNRRSREWRERLR